MTEFLIAISQLCSEMKHPKACEKKVLECFNNLLGVGFDSKEYEEGLQWCVHHYERFSEMVK